MKNLNTLVTSVIKIAEPIIDALKDSKISWAEGGSIAAAIAFNAMPLIKSAPDAWSEIKDLTPDQVTIMRNIFKKDFDIENDEHERKIEAAFDFIISVAPATSQFIKALS